MSSNKHIPLRTCIVTRERKPKSELARLVFDTVTGTVALDQTGKAKGRGANISTSLDIFDKAVETRALERAFKSKIDRNNLSTLRAEFEKYIIKLQFRNGEKHVTVRIPGEAIKIS